MPCWRRSSDGAAHHELALGRGRASPVDAGGTDSPVGRSGDAWAGQAAGTGRDGGRDGNVGCVLSRMAAGDGVLSRLLTRVCAVLEVMMFADRPALGVSTRRRSVTPALRDCGKPAV